MGFTVDLAAGTDKRQMLASIHFKLAGKESFIFGSTCVYSSVSVSSQIFHDPLEHFNKINTPKVRLTSYLWGTYLT